jgi:hypothetical protein
VGRVCWFELFDVARRVRVLGSLMGRPGDDRLSRVLRRSTIGAEGFHGRVRNGIGCWAPRYDHQVVSSENTTSAGMNDLMPSLVEGSCPKEDCAAWRAAPDGRAATARRSRSDCARIARPAGALQHPPVATIEEVGDQANRAIRTGRLNALPRFHPRPINVVVYHGSQARPGFEGGFPLRCIQRLSRPHIATRRCRWRDNRYTRGASIPVLSY